MALINIRQYGAGGIPTKLQEWLNQLLRLIKDAEHNNLAGLQGGTSGEYYHLTAAERAKLQNDLERGAILSALQPVKGFVPTRNSGTEMTFSAGSVTTASGIYTRSSSIQKILGTTWAEGNAAGGQFSGATIDPTDDYYAIAISKDSSPQTVDVGFDDNPSGTNAPAGWSVLKEVYRGMTDDLGNLIAAITRETAGGGLYAEYDVSVQEFSDNSTGTSRVAKTLNAVPPNTRGHILWTLLESGASSTDIEAKITELQQTDTAPGPSNYDVRVRATDGSDDASNTVNLPKVTNASRQLGYRLSVTATAIFIQAHTLGYWLERR